MDYESQVNELKEGLAKLQNSHFVEALNGQRFLQGAEVNEFCREIQASEHGKELNVVRKKVEGFSSASGGRVAILCCSERVKGCSFIITCTRGRDDDKPFTVDEKRTNLVHGGITPGTDVPMICLGVITPSSSDVCTDPIYLALRGKGSNRKGKGTSTKVVKAAYAIHHGVSAPTTDVVKKANAMSKVSVVELVETYNYILSFCEIAKEMNPDFCYDISKDSLNRINKMAVLFPHCKKMFPRCHPLLGLDSAHLPVVKLKDVTTELLEKVKRGDLVRKSGFILKMRGATTQHEYNEEMKVMETMKHGPACVAYLNGVDGVWQLYKVIERGNIIHEVKSDNIVEATFSVHLEERHDPSLFVFLQEMYCRCCERMNKMKQKIQDLGQQEILVPVAKASDTILEVPHLPEVIHRASLEPDKYAMFPRFTATTGVSASSKRIASQGDKASGGGMSQGALRSLGRYDCVRCNTNLAICSTHPSSRCGLNMERAEKKRNPGCTVPVNKPYEVSAAAEHIPFTFDESLFDDMASDP
eukprot:gene19601-22287_t